jgi:hypothetical protein
MAAVSGRCGEASHGEKTQDLPDLAGLLRSGDGRSLHESRSGSVGRRQQSLPSGRGEGEPRPGRHRRDHGKARRRSQAPGWNRPFSEHAELPTDLGGGGPTKAARKSKGPKAKQPSSRPVDKAAERKAALAFEKEQKQRQRERASEETARQKDRERRQQAVDKAQAALEKAEQEHAKRAAAIQAEVEALEKRSQAEKTRWDKEKERLEAALRRARG